MKHEKTSVEVLIYVSFRRGQILLTYAALLAKGKGKIESALLLRVVYAQKIGWHMFL